LDGPLRAALKKADQENICTFASTSISSSSAIFKDTVIKNTFWKAFDPCFQMVNKCLPHLYW
jgi:hypothetical protein